MTAKERAVRAAAQERFFESPVSGGNLEVAATNFHVRPSGGAFSARVACQRIAGVGVWTVDDGALVYFEAKADALVWAAAENGLVAASVANMVELVGRHAARVTGVPTRIRTFDGETLELRNELVFGLPQCGVEALVPSPTGRLVLAFLNSGQGETGYELFSIAGELRQLHMGPIFSHLGSVDGTPIFSPSDRLVAHATTNEANPYWWVDRQDNDVDWHTPSRGGVMTAGLLFLQDLESAKTSRHELRLHVKPGWHPREQDSGWCARVLRFVGEDRLRLKVPRLGVRELKLPLGRQIELDR